MAKKIFCDIDRCTGCKTCELACAVEHSESKELLKALFEEAIPQQRLEAVSVEGEPFSFGCQHCAEAACVDACMANAMQKAKDGSTVCYEDKCVGCWMCIMACPFGVIRKKRGVKKSLKCDLCPDRDDYACVAGCPTEALFGGTGEEFKRWLKKPEEKTA